MKKEILFLSLVVAMSWHSSANAFNPIDWLFGSKVEDMVKDVIKDSAIDLVKQEADKKLQSVKGVPEKKDTAKQGKEAPAIATAHKALPLTGPYRFSVPQGKSIDSLERGERNGYLDWFENEWVPALDAKGKIIGWNEYLSAKGRKRLGSSVERAGAGDSSFVRVDLKGEKLSKG